MNHIKVRQMDATCVRIENTTGQGRHEDFDFGGHRVCAQDFALSMRHFVETWDMAFLEQAKDYIEAGYGYWTDECHDAKARIHHILKTR